MGRRVRRIGEAEYCVQDAAITATTGGHRICLSAAHKPAAAGGRK